MDDFFCPKCGNAHDSGLVCNGGKMSDEIKYQVTIKNKILGNSVQIMTMAEIAKYNLCALECAEQVRKNGGVCTIGMWTVRQERKIGA